MTIQIHDKGGEMDGMRGCVLRTSATAFVVTPIPEADYSPAHVFVSSIEIIGGPILSPNASSSWHQPAIDHIRKSLSNYIPGLDYIIPTGAPVRMMLVAMVLREKAPHHKLLGWDTRSSRYFCYEFNLVYG